MKIAFLLYPTKNIIPSEDTSFWMMLALSNAGHKVYHFASDEMFANREGIWAHLNESKLSAVKGFYHSKHIKKPCNLEKLDALIIRKEPPFNAEYLHTLQLLSTLEKKILIINRPSSMIRFNEKTSILNFPDHIPASLATSDLSYALDFTQRNSSKKIIIKVLDEKGGKGIGLTNSKRNSVTTLFNRLSNHGKHPVMLQEYLNVCKHGDKRILLMGGSIIGAYVRVPASGNYLANISQGASFHKTTLSKRETNIALSVSSFFKKYGLTFLGIDLIDERLTEINFTSPAGIADLITLYKTQPQKLFQAYLEKEIVKFKRLNKQI